MLGALWLYDRWAGGALRLATGWALLGLLLFSGCCLVSRRLHDLGWAGWWAAAVWALVLLAWPAPRGGLGAIGLGLLVPAALWLCAMPGQGRPNRFGPALRR